MSGEGAQPSPFAQVLETTVCVIGITKLTSSTPRSFRDTYHKLDAVGTLLALWGVVIST